MWFNANKLTLNLDKTCYSVFGVSDTDRSNISLKIGDNVIQQVGYSKYLGVFIDTNLSWEKHIDYVNNKIIKFVGIFYRIRHKLNFEMAKMLYYAFVHSYLAYGIEIYGNTYMKYLNKLIVLNNKILRILQFAPFDTPVRQLYSTFNTLPITDLHDLQILKFVHKFIHHPHQLPLVFLSYFNKNHMFHSYDTRKRDDLHSLSFVTSIGQRSITYKGTKLWNTLPDNLKGIVSTHKFIDCTKQFLITR
jgi:hypothetical protein